jgi:molybdate-binding protein/DNA-binding transcriptional regulator YhcF (GntR family)
MIQVDPWSDVPVYQQIVEQVRVGVAVGRLSPGERLEPVRQMAQRLEINPSTVARAYQALEREGIIETNRRGGSMVARHQDAARLRATREARLRGILERALVESLGQGFSPEEVQAGFELQLAAWRERRETREQEGYPHPGEPAATAVDRLARFAGSHDLALEALWGQARRTYPGLSLGVNYVGSLEGLLGLLQGETGLAGAHILDEDSGEYNLPILRRLFVGQALCVVTLAEREQGLIMAADNPHRLQRLSDLAEGQLRFVNRQPGSGTRTLLDHLLRQEGLTGERIQGFGWTVPTHLAVAAAVAGGQADAGLGLLAAARAYGLGFVPLAQERYDLILRAEDRERSPLDELLALIRTPAYQALLGQLGGYITTHTGEETYL